MLDNIPEVQARTRLIRRPTTILVGNRQFPEVVDTVDPNFLQVIRLPMIAGDPASALAKPESAVLSQTAARKYFGDRYPIGKTIIMSKQKCDDSYENCQVQHAAQGRGDDTQHLRRIARKSRGTRELGLYQRLGLCPPCSRGRSGCRPGEIPSGHRSFGQPHENGECPKTRQ
jgi:hypothetical protein